MKHNILFNLLTVSSVLYSGVLAQWPSTEGQCGKANGYTCRGSGFGNCCSAWGYCGSSDVYCGDGCQTRYGTCSNSGAVTQDGSCGDTGMGATCAGSGLGNCCSQWGWCGNTDVFCGLGCQAGFGSCGPQSLVASVVAPSSIAQISSVLTIRGASAVASSAAQAAVSAISVDADPFSRKVKAPAAQSSRVLVMLSAMPRIASPSVVTSSLAPASSS